MSILQKLPNECPRCGQEAYEYTVGKHVSLEKDEENNFYRAFAYDGVSSINCSLCKCEILATNDLPDLEVDELIDG